MNRDWRDILRKFKEDIERIRIMGTEGGTIRAGDEFTPRSFANIKASAIAQAEVDARPDRPRIQPEEIDYIRKAAEAPDVNLFLAVI